MKELVISNNWVKSTNEVEDEMKIYNYLIQVYCIFEDKKLPPISERALLSYYIRWGINKKTEEKYMQDYNRTYQVTANLKTMLCKRKMLIKDKVRNIYRLPVEFQTRWTDSLTIVLELNVAKRDIQEGI